MSGGGLIVGQKETGFVSVVEFVELVGRQGRRTSKKPLFISWSAFSRRIASMDEFFGYEMQYFPPPFPQRWAKPFGYFIQAFRTARFIIGYQPNEVWLHCPPTFLCQLALLVRPLGGGYRIVADCHFGAFIRRWTRVPGTIWAVNRADVILVHNEESFPIADGLGVDRSKVVMLEDPPPAHLPAGSPRVANEETQPYVLVPCSFNEDEPIPVLMEAARRAPDIRILVTGSRQKAEWLGYTQDAPPNVRFTDYLALDEFEGLLSGAAVVFGLTNVEGIQLSVANEALGGNKALVLSDTTILRSMFGEAALFTLNTPEAIATALRDALARRPALEAASAALKVRRQADWRAPAEKVARMLAAARR